MKVADGSELFGEPLERHLQRTMAYRKLLQQVTRRGHPPAIVSALLEFDARDKSFFEQRDRLDVIAARMTTPTRTVSVTRDDEHNVFALHIEDRSPGYPRRYEIGVDFITSGEYRILASAYREIHDITFPVVVTTSDTPREEEPAEEAAEAAGDEGDGAPRRNADRTGAAVAQRTRHQAE